MSDASAPARLEGFPNLVGAHCSSSAVRSALAWDGLRLSEAVVFGLGSGLGFFYAREPGRSPSRRFNGRAPDLEGSFYRLVGSPLSWEGAWRPEAIDAALAAGRPVLAQTDIHPIPYYDDAHFIGHGVAVIGRDGDELLVADIAAAAPSRMSLAQFRAAVAVEHAPLMRPYRYAAAPRLARVDAARLAPRAIARSCRYLLEPPGPGEGIPGMRRLAAELPSWAGLEDAAWCARFGYQAIEKRGTGGGNFRRLYADFLDELGPPWAAQAAAFRACADGWTEVASALKEAAFADGAGARLEPLGRAAAGVAALAEREEAVLGRLAALAEEGLERSG